MKITVFYEDKNRAIELDVPDEECEVWVEEDYRRRLSEADGKGVVKRRTAQEIMEEDYNRPTFNNQKRESRRHVSLDALDPDTENFGGTVDPQDEVLRLEENLKLYHAIEKLRPRQRELVRMVFWEGMQTTEVARLEGVARSTVSDRMTRISARLKRILLKK